MKCEANCAFGLVRMIFATAMLAMTMSHATSRKYVSSLIGLWICGRLGQNAAVSGGIASPRISPSTSVFSDSVFASNTQIAVSTSVSSG
jgi:hypothetical protein